MEAPHPIRPRLWLLGLCLIPALILFALGCTDTHLKPCGCTPPPTVEVSGRFTDEAGNPLGDVAVADSSARTDADGRYRMVFAPVPGRNRIFAQPWDGTHCYETAFSAPVAAEPRAQTINLVFKATPPGIIEGSIDPAIAPNEIYRVEFYQQLSDGPLAFELPVRSVDGTVLEGQSSYRAEGLPAGNYILHLTRITTEGNRQFFSYSMSNGGASLTEGGKTTAPLQFWQPD